MSEPAKIPDAIENAISDYGEARHEDRADWLDERVALQAAITAFAAAEFRRGVEACIKVLCDNDCEDYYHGCCDDKNAAAMLALLPAPPAAAEEKTK